MGGFMRLRWNYVAIHNEYGGEVAELDLPLEQDVLCFKPIFGTKEKRAVRQWL